MPIYRDHPDEKGTFGSSMSTALALHRKEKEEEEEKKKKEAGEKKLGMRSAHSVEKDTVAGMHDEEEMHGSLGSAMEDDEEKY